MNTQLQLIHLPQTATGLLFNYGVVEPQAEEPLLQMATEVVVVELESTLMAK
jgi:hypothetical protein